MEFREEIQNPESYLRLRAQDYVAVIALHEEKITIVNQIRIALNINED